MGFIAQNTVAYIIIVGDLDIVEEDHVFQLYGVAHHAVFANQGAAPDESAVPDFCTGPDDAGGTQKGRRGYSGGFVYPNLGLYFFVIVPQMFAQSCLMPERASQG